MIQIETGLIAAIIMFASMAWLKTREVIRLEKKVKDMTNDISKLHKDKVKSDEKYSLLVNKYSSSIQRSKEETERLNIKIKEVEQLIGDIRGEVKHW